MSDSSPPPWEELHPRFVRVAAERKPAVFARQIPAAKQSVYNWIKGVHRPNRAAMARIAEIVKEQEDG